MCLLCSYKCRSFTNGTKMSTSLLRPMFLVIKYNFQFILVAFQFFKIINIFDKVQMAQWQIGGGSNSVSFCQCVLKY